MPKPVFIDSEAADRNAARSKRPGVKGGSTATQRAGLSPGYVPGKGMQSSRNSTAGDEVYAELFPSKATPPAGSAAPQSRGLTPPGQGPRSGRFYVPPGNTQPYTIHPKRDINAEVRAGVNPPNKGNLDPASIPAMLAKNQALYAPHDGITIDPLADVAPRTLTKAESDSIFGQTPEDAQLDGMTKTVAGANVTVKTPYGGVKSNQTPPPADWQEKIVEKYPQIGVAGTPENKAFVAAFQKHGAWERGMDDAAEIISRIASTQAKAAKKTPERVDASLQNRLDYLS